MLISLQTIMVPMSSLVKTADLRGWWHRTQKGRCGLKSVKFTPFLNKPQTKNAVFRCVDIGAKHAVMNVGMLLNVCQDSVFFCSFQKFLLGTASKNDFNKCVLNSELVRYVSILQND